MCDSGHAWFPGMMTVVEAGVRWPREFVARCGRALNRWLRVSDFESRSLGICCRVGGLIGEFYKCRIG